MAISLNSFTSNGVNVIELSTTVEGERVEIEEALQAIVDSNSALSLSVGTTNADRSLDIQKTGTALFQLRLCVNRAVLYHGFDFQTVITMSNGVDISMLGALPTVSGTTTSNVDGNTGRWEHKRGILSILKPSTFSTTGEFNQGIRSVDRGVKDNQNRIQAGSAIICGGVDNSVDVTSTFFVRTMTGQRNDLDVFSDASGDLKVYWREGNASWSHYLYPNLNLTVIDTNSSANSNGEHGALAPEVYNEALGVNCRTYGPFAAGVLPDGSSGGPSTSISLRGSGADIGTAEQVMVGQATKTFRNFQVTNSANQVDITNIDSAASRNSMTTNPFTGDSPAYVNSHTIRFNHTDFDGNAVTT